MTAEPRAEASASEEIPLNLPLVQHPVLVHWTDKLFVRGEALCSQYKVRTAKGGKKWWAESLGRQGFDNT